MKATSPVPREAASRSSTVLALDVEATTGMTILLAIDRQTDCVYCTYRNDRSLRDLLAHEQNQHGSSNMSTMEGYLRLVRQGLDTDEALV